MTVNGTTFKSRAQRGLAAPAAGNLAQRGRPEVRRQSRVSYASDSLTDMAWKLGPGGKLPTVRQLRDSLGVANTTLISALHDLEERGVVDRRHGSGLYVSPRIGQKTIGLLLGRYSFTRGSPFFAMLVQLCERRARSHHERFKFYVYMPEPMSETGSPLVHRDFVEDVEAGKLQGLLRTCEISEAEQAWLRDRHVPMVSGLMVALENTPAVVNMDTAEMVRMGVRTLASRGCRRIGLLTPFGFARNLDPPYEVDRHAYREAMGRVGLEFRPEWIWDERMAGWPAQVPDSFGRWDEQGGRAMQALFGDGKSDSQRPDGLVITDDVMARGALLAARQMGLVVGKDIRIATHANKGSPVLELCEEPLTLLEFDGMEVVEAMFAMLERLMEGEKPSNRQVLIAPRQVECGA